MREGVAGWPGFYDVGGVVLAGGVGEGSASSMT